MSRPEEQLKKEVESLISKVPADKFPMLIEFMEFLIEKRELRTLDEHLANPEYDDEPETEEDRAAIAEALEDIKEGRVYDLDTVAEELGLCPKEK